MISGLIIILGIAASSCSNLNNQFTKTTSGLGAGDYDVFFYSGGKPISLYKVYGGFVTEEEGSDGWYFSCKGKLVRMSGQVIVEPMNFSSDKQIADNVIDCR